MAGFIALKSVHTLKVVFIFFIKHYHRQYYYPIIEFFQALHNGQGIKPFILIRNKYSFLLKKITQTVMPIRLAFCKMATNLL